MNNAVAPAHHSPLQQRSCQKCGKTQTTQWRYGSCGNSSQPENMLLCNACGIRWKRKHKASVQSKIKPGPKRSRPQHRTSAQRATSIAPAPTYPNQPAQQMHTPTLVNESKKPRSIKDLLTTTQDYHRSNQSYVPGKTGIPIQRLLNQPDDRQRK